jgi:FkbM family methyltransferase
VFNLDEQQQRLAFYLGDILREELNLITAYCRKQRGAFLDVGANVGLYTVGVLSAWPEGTGIAFEPGGRNFDQLIRNIALAGLTERVKAVRLGLSNCSCHHSLAYNKLGHNRGSSNAAIVDDWEPGKTVLWKEGDLEHQERIDCVAFDQWCADHGSAEPVAFAKLDIEGHEPEALLGMQGTLQKHRPGLLLELNAFCLEQGGKSVERVNQQLESLRYRGFKFLGGRLQRRRLEPGCHEMDTFWFPEEVLPRLGELLPVC